MQVQRRRRRNPVPIDSALPVEPTAQTGTARNRQIADRQADTIETKASDVRAIRRKTVRVEHRPRKHDDNRRDEHLTHPNYRPRRDEGRSQPPPRYQLHYRRTNSKTTTRSCRRCGGNFPHTDTCPAMGKTCNYCKKPNHFAKVCRNRKHTSVHEITASKHTGSSDSSEDDFCYAVKDTKRRTPAAKVRINDVDVNIMVDTGASVNTLDEGTYGKIGNPKLTTRKPVRLMPYGGGPKLTVIGQCTMTVETRREIQSHDFHVVRNGNSALLGYTTATDLGLIKYRPSSENPADYMSRHPVNMKTTNQRCVADEYVSFIAETSIPKAMTWKDVHTASVEDEATTQALKFVQNGRWFEIETVTNRQIQKELKEIAKVKDELTEHDGVLLRGTQIVLPTTLRDKAVAIAHEGRANQVADKEQSAGSGTICRLPCVLQTPSVLSRSN